MKRILSIDTAMFGCSVTLAQYEVGKAPVYLSQSKDMRRGQAEQLVPMIETVMAEADISYDHLDGVAVCHGPGAFTGIRIALSTARALALSLNIPVIGISSFEAIYAAFACQYAIDKDVLIVLETKRDDYYYAIYGAGGDVHIAPRAGLATDIVNDLSKGQEIHLIGDGAPRLQGDIADSHIHAEYIDGYSLISTESLADIFIDQIEGCDWSDGYLSHNAAPLYLRGADVSKSKKTYKSIAK